ncbi:ABC transporter ATP-binding protein [Pseudoflavonifractor phocaeensis]|uniref:ABC transporter ATP-binding protein n=1 Tax=Pseudoflavonifractor phocaeensis TaxID=1870988 RepID=UPI001956ED83|nr:ABC transporter ATP-binding protein [Pseudoflavonifractor phocaeensis]MBM6936950.1 ABC transporter ATP-binding protein [Pseudoflavonifractor phocaeensis]
MIEVRDLVKRYGAHLAVDHLSFSVPDGQIFGFLGPNGAGKSTTMNIMTGYLGATEGEVLVDGHSITDEPELVKRSVGYLPELPPLYMDMTCEEYLLFAAGLKKVSRKDRNSQVDRVMEMTGTMTVRGRLIRNLSKGYRQRVGLAQALLGFPKVLILDEPTVGLDPKQILEIRTLIRSLSKNHTILLSSHILSEVQEVCDHLLIIHHGRKVACGAPDELERELADEPTLELTLRGTDSQARAMLAGVPSVAALSPLPTREENAVSYRLEQATGADIREDLFHACAQAGLPILALRRDALTLEDIFLRLTSDDPGQQPGVSRTPDTSAAAPTQEGEQAQ